LPPDTRRWVSRGAESGAALRQLVVSQSPGRTVGEAHPAGNVSTAENPPEGTAEAGEHSPPSSLPSDRLCVPPRAAPAAPPPPPLCAAPPPATQPSASVLPRPPPRELLRGGLPSRLLPPPPRSPEENESCQRHLVRCTLLTHDIGGGGGCVLALLLHNPKLHLSPLPPRGFLRPNLLRTTSAGRRWEVT
jgi:hypothetical protein